MLMCVLLAGTAVLPVVWTMNDVKDNGNISMLNKKCGCCQNGGQPIVLTVGRCDDFDPSPPAETTSPSHALLDWIDANYQGTKGSRDCDEDVINQYWAHTFDLSGLCRDCNIGKATFSITVKNLGYNDALGLGCVEGASYKWSNGVYGQLDNVYGISVGDVGTINLDLSGDYPGFFNEMVNHCYLDVIVQDDSMVDCATLTIECCTCELDVEIQRGFHSGTSSIPIIIRNTGTTDCDVQYTITCIVILGSVSFGSSGTISPLPAGEDAFPNCPTSGCGIAQITVTAEACGGRLIFTDTAYVLVIGPFILVFG